MKSLFEILLEFNFNRFIVISDSQPLIRDLKNVFSGNALLDATNCAKPLTTISVISEPADTYSVDVKGLEINRISIEEAAYVTMRIISDSFVDHISNRLLVMHAAAAAFYDSAILFAGCSGSGKTSLALAFSRFDGLIGDECAYVDIKTGTTYYEAFPFQLKESNHDLSSCFSKANHLDVFDQNIGKASYYALSSVKMASRQPTTISTIVFPKFKRAETTLIEKLNPSDYAPLILGSVIGPYHPSTTLALFTRMCSEQKIQFLKITYSNVSDGATTLYNFLSKGAK